MMMHDIEQVAEMLSVSLRTVQSWISDGELAAVNVSRNRNSRKPRLRIRQSDLDQFLDARQVQSETTAKPARRRSKPSDTIPQYV